MENRQDKQLKAEVSANREALEKIATMIVLLENEIQAVQQLKRTETPETDKSSK